MKSVLILPLQEPVSHSFQTSSAKCLFSGKPLQQLAMWSRTATAKLLSLWLATATAQYVRVPQTPAEPQWAASHRNIQPRAGNSSAWPYGPFNTKGRDIVNARGDVISWAGVNWPLNLETMVPEGLVSTFRKLDSFLAVSQIISIHWEVEA